MFHDPKVINYECIGLERIEKLIEFKNKKNEQI